MTLAHPIDPSHSETTPDAARHTCGQWIPDIRRYCRSTDDVRPFLPGLRCSSHTPAALVGNDEPPSIPLAVAA